MAADKRLGTRTDKNETVIVDYGGANVAKPLHVGHLRSAIIGESIKRTLKYIGYNTVGDVHLGDWGLQMGLIIEELRIRKPELVYFDDSYNGEYPKEAPFTISELEEIYPCASAKAKEDEEFSKRAHEATAQMQKGKPGYIALWRHILNVSSVDLKRNYDNLDVHFDIWKGESDAEPYINDMLEDFVKRGVAYESEGALVIDVAQPSDTKEIPPCIVRKSDGASIYATSDLATIIEREKLYKPSHYIYLTDKRQELYFKQMFRAARKAGLLKPETKMDFLGFGTMNGKDGKPFKTRAGGVLRLEYLLEDVRKAVFDKIKENRTVSDEEAESTAKIIALAAIKFGDLSNQPSKDYIFDMDRFTSFEGKTGPYILYTIVRIKSILNKLAEQNGGNFTDSGDILSDASVDFGCIGEYGPVNMQTCAKAAKIAGMNAPKAFTDLLLAVTGIAENIEGAADELAPYRLCAFIYELSDLFNVFYHENKIIGEPDLKKQKIWVSVLKLTLNELELGIKLLGFSAPDRM
jgi:arginyl-tRNA synthetase